MAENPLILAIDWQQPENCSHEDAIRICRRLLGDSDPQKSELGTILFTFSCHKRFNFCHISDSVESNEYEMKNVFGWLKDKIKNYTIWDCIKVTDFEILFNLNSLEWSRLENIMLPGFIYRR